MSSPASPGLNALAVAARAAYDNDKTQTKIGGFRREQVWERGSIESTMAYEEYFMFRNNRATLIAAIRKYKAPSPRFHSIMDYSTHAWGVLGVGSTPMAAMTALYSGESDHTASDLARRFAASCRDGSLITAWDQQARDWNLQGWGFFIDGLTSRYQTLFKEVDFTVTDLEDGRRWIRNLPKEDDTDER